MKVTILRSTLADEGKDFGPGDTPTLSDHEAIALISIGAAKRFSESSPESAEAKHPAKETAARKIK